MTDNGPSSISASGHPVIMDTALPAEVDPRAPSTVAAGLAGAVVLSAMGRGKRGATPRTPTPGPALPPVPLKRARTLASIPAEAASGNTRSEHPRVGDMEARLQHELNENAELRQRLQFLEQNAAAWEPPAAAGGAGEESYLDDDPPSPQPRPSRRTRRA